MEENMKRKRLSKQREKTRRRMAVGNAGEEMERLNNRAEDEEDKSRRNMKLLKKVK